MLSAPARHLLVVLMLSLHALCSAAEVDPESAWRFPELRASWRESLQWSRTLREAGPTSETLTMMRKSMHTGSGSRAMGAWLASCDSPTTPLIGGARFTELREEAIEGLSTGNRRWGGRPLMESMVNPAVFRGESVLPNHLIDQFRPDDVPNNAFDAAEIYLVGMQEDPRRFLPELVSRWSALRRAGNAASQEGVFVANLLLVYALSDPEQFSKRSLSWWYALQGWRSDETWPATGLDAMTRAESDAVLDAAVFWAPGSRGWMLGDTAEIGEAARHHAWFLLEVANPAPTKQYREILASRKGSERDRQHALLLLIIREPTSLYDPRMEEAILAGCEVSYWGYYPTRLTTALVDPHMTPGERIESLLWEAGRSLRAPIERVFPNGRLLTDPERQRLLSIIAAGLERTTIPYSQLTLANVLLRSTRETSVDAVAEAAVSNLANDDYGGNAAGARDLLDSLGSAGVDALRAGLNVGVELGDWQLISECADRLVQSDESFAHAAHPEAMAAMAEHLRDDEVAGNGMAASDYLRSCGEAARPLLESLRDIGDDQQKEFAEDLLRELNDARSPSNSELTLIHFATEFSQ